MPLMGIRPPDVSAFHMVMAAKGLGARSRRTIHGLLVTMCTFATRLGLMPGSPVLKELCPKVEPKEKAILTSDQWWQLWDILKRPEYNRFRAFYGVLMFTSIRGGEALGLKWEDVDFATRTLRVRRQFYRWRECTPKTRKSKRDRHMTEELSKALLLHRQMTHYTALTDYVFAASTGNPVDPDQLRMLLQHILREELGIHLPPREDGLHLLRHTSGSWVYKKAGPKEAQAALGHAQIQTTLGICTHIPEGTGDETTDRVFAREAPTEALTLVD